MVFRSFFILLFIIWKLLHWFIIDLWIKLFFLILLLNI
jgi:hypothetical protein